MPDCKCGIPETLCGNCGYGWCANFIVNLMTPRLPEWEKTTAWEFSDDGAVEHCIRCEDPACPETTGATERPERSEMYENWGVRDELEADIARDNQEEAYDHGVLDGVAQGRGERDAEIARLRAERDEYFAERNTFSTRLSEARIEIARLKALIETTKRRNAAKEAK